MNPSLNIAIRAARRAGDIIVRALNRGNDIQFKSKGLNDFTTEIDNQAESAIIDTILKAYPDHAILAEESGSHKGNDYEWIIDPLDGTTNFMHGHPQFCVSIALKHKGILKDAVIYDPLRQELFVASQGAGAFLNDRRIRVSHCDSLNTALVGTGFPFKSANYLEVFIDIFRTIFPQTSGMRRAGSAALDLAYIASGRLDGFWEIGLNPWDIAAGVLLVREAGGLVTDFAGKNGYFKTGNIIAANPRISREILKNIQPHLPDNLKN